MAIVLQRRSYYGFRLSVPLGSVCVCLHVYVFFSCFFLGFHFCLFPKEREKESMELEGYGSGEETEEEKP